MGSFESMSRLSRSISWPARAAVLALGIGGAAATRGSALKPALPSASSSVADDSADAKRPLWMEMRNVRLHVDQSAAMRVAELRGEAVPTKAGSVVILDDPNSFLVQVSSGRIALDGPALSALMYEVVFAYKGAPVRDLKVSVVDGALVQSGILHKGVDLPFKMTASVTLMPDSRLRVHPTSMRMMGIDGEKLMHALGLHLKNFLDARGARGLTVEGDDMLLDPLQMMPPPTVRGRVAGVRLDSSTMVVEFARTSADSIFGTLVRTDSGSVNYVHFRGGRLRFGRLEMRDTDLLINDADVTNWFDLYLEHYAEQLSAGYSRTMPNAALRVVMPDYRFVAAGGSVKPPPVPSVVGAR